MGCITGDGMRCVAISGSTIQPPIEIALLGRMPTDRESALRSSTTDFTCSDSSCMQAIDFRGGDGTHTNIQKPPAPVFFHIKRNVANQGLHP